MANEGTRFDAFLSYKSDDRDFAVKLEKALEGYTVPRGVRAKAGAPTHLDICRDEEDFQGNHLKSTIEEYLDASRKLIVVCSPRAAKSEYVSHEIRHFLERKGFEAFQKDLLLVLIDGDPAADKDGPDSPRPPALPDEIDEPLYIDFRDKVREGDRLERGDCWWKLLSNLLDLPVRDLQNREANARAKRRRMVISVVAVVVTGLSASTSYAFVQESKAVDARLAAETSKDAAVEARTKAEKARREAEAARKEAEANYQELMASREKGKVLEANLETKAGELEKVQKNLQSETQKAQRALTRAAEEMGHVDTLLDRNEALQIGAQAFQQELGRCSRAYHDERAQREKFEVAAYRHIGKLGDEISRLQETASHAQGEADEAQAIAQQCYERLRECRAQVAAPPVAAAWEEEGAAEEAAGYEYDEGP